MLAGKFRLNLFLLFLLVTFSLQFLIRYFNILEPKGPNFILREDI